MVLKNFMNWIWLYLPIVLVAADFLIFILLSSIATPPYTFNYTYGNNIIEMVMLLAGGITMLIILIKFLSLYLKNKNITRLLVMLAMLFYALACIIEFIKTTISYSEPTIRRYQIDLPFIMFSITIYYFVFFGITVLINWKFQKQFTRLMNLMIILQIASFFFHYLSWIIVLPTHATMNSLLRIIAEIPLFLIFILDIIILINMTVKCFKLSKKADNQSFKKGLQSLGFAILMILLVIFFLLLSNFANPLGGDLDLFRLLSLACVISCNYFIYNGIIKPAKN
ncbi:MAG: hypothetical protein ACTSRA_15585 [Promethearchaeota archaeon]